MGGAPIAKSKTKKSREQKNQGPEGRAATLPDDQPLLIGQFPRFQGSGVAEGEGLCDGACVCGDLETAGVALEPGDCGALLVIGSGYRGGYIVDLRCEVAGAGYLGDMCFAFLGGIGK